ncbi:MAG: hypothetical protein H6707_20105 [Deltaproteobacteria bacterium]|nr:hypothetical protein [Deltaproteobacteria bacterium]
MTAGGPFTGQLAPVVGLWGPDFTARLLRSRGGVQAKGLSHAVVAFGLFLGMIQVGWAASPRPASSAKSQGERGRRALSVFEQLAPRLRFRLLTDHRIDGSQRFRREYDGQSNAGILHLTRDGRRAVMKIFESTVELGDQPFDPRMCDVIRDQLCRGRMTTIYGVEELQSHLLMEQAGGPGILELGLIEKDHDGMPHFYALMEHVVPSHSSSERASSLRRFADADDPQRALNRFVPAKYRAALFQAVADKIVGALSRGITPGVDPQLMITTQGNAQWIDSDTFTRIDAKTESLAALVSVTREFAEQLSDLRTDLEFETTVYQAALGSPLGKALKAQLAALTIDQLQTFLPRRDRSVNLLKLMRDELKQQFVAAEALLDAARSPLVQSRD